MSLLSCPRCAQEGEGDELLPGFTIYTCSCGGVFIFNAFGVAIEVPLDEELDGVRHRLDELLLKEHQGR
jgi:hypothetical protein